MKPRKKTLPQKTQEEEAEKNFSEIFEKAEQGDTHSMLRILKESGRGYEMRENDWSEILRTI